MRLPASEKGDPFGHFSPSDAITKISFILFGHILIIRQSSKPLRNFSGKKHVYTYRSYNIVALTLREWELLKMTAARIDVV